MSAGFVERLSPREFLDIDRLFKPIPRDAEITEWRIPERVLHEYGYDKLLGYTGSGVLARAERARDETLWFFIGRKTPKKLFASRIPPFGACQLLVRAGFDLPDELKPFAEPVPHVKEERGSRADVSQSTAPGDKMAPPKGKRGRPQDTDPAEDRRIAEAWATKQYKTREALAQSFGMSKPEAIRAIDRHRKRPGAAGKTPTRKPRQEP